METEVFIDTFLHEIFLILIIDDLPLLILSVMSGVSDNSLSFNILTA
jgi:hypothetical protein